MALSELNGWNAPRLDKLQDDVETIREKQIEMNVHVLQGAESIAEINATLKTMQSDEMVTLRARVKELEGRPWLLAIGVGSPVVASIIVLLLSHVF